MIRNGFKTMVFTFPFFAKDHDTVSKDSKTVKEADLSIVEQETGWSRVRQIFKADDFDRLSVELHSIIQVSCISCIVGIVYGGTVYSKQAYLNFIKNNQATSFTNHYEAKQQLQDCVTKAFAKGAFRWSWRLTAFSSTYVTCSTCLAAYRGKNGILEHTLAGTSAGALYKFKVGPRAMLVGGILGGILGTLGGILTLSALQMTGMTMQEVRYWNYKWYEHRSDAFNKGFQKHFDKERSDLYKERESKLGNIGGDLDFVDTKS
ncbi:hypothetical protein FQA39_LY09931 [Lamprigera yunnana]|nr:hypothetical protein FQA39_LY09931 [Lamprigera yunnana]